MNLKNIKKNRFQPSESPTGKIIAVEASAGTGKTYNIVRTYLRLLLESGKKYPEKAVERILIVTFTIAATLELKDRIRSLLINVREIMNSDLALPESRDIDEDVLSIIKSYDPALVKKTVSFALSNFDRAAVHTIHGFCHSTLSRFAFESGLSFKPELTEDVTELLDRSVQNFWRRHFLYEEEDFVQYLFSRKVSTEKFRRIVESCLRMNAEDIISPSAPALNEKDGRKIFDTIKSQYSSLKEKWSSAKPEMIEYFRDQDKILNGQRYRTNYISGRVEKIDTYFQNIIPEPPANELEYFSGDTIFAAFNKKGPYVEPPPFSLDVKGFLDISRKYYEGLLVKLIRSYGQALKESREEMRFFKKQSNTLDFNDLLLSLDQALRAPASGIRLTQTLRDTYDAALIDEFQDTDPVQWRIFETIFKNTGKSLFLIGDPKQSIYRFRHADIRTYIQARDSSDSIFSLEENHRSAPAMVESVNILFNKRFGNTPIGPFLNEKIEYPTAKSAFSSSEFSGRGEVLEHSEQDFSDSSALRILSDLSESSESSLRDAPTSVQLATRGIVSRIASILSDSSKGNGYFRSRNDGTTRKIEASNMAVIVRSHWQAEKIRNALREAGIPSVIRTDESVFETNESLDMVKILRAIENSGSSSIVRAALATETIGYSIALLEDEEKMQEAFYSFYRLSIIRQRDGAMPAMRNLMRDFNIHTHLLSLKDGERRYTNFMHLSELMHRAKNDNTSGDIRWLVRNRSKAYRETQGSEVRLESDRDAVEIVTAHASKGLEYDIVFIPFPWSFGISKKDSPEILFDRRGDIINGYVAEMATCKTPVTKETTNSTLFDELKFSERLETMSEEIRLFYVAITRAKHRCYMFWTNTKNIKNSAPGFLIHGLVDDEIVRMIKNVAQDDSLNSSGLLADLKEFSLHDGLIEISTEVSTDSTLQISGHHDFSEINPLVFNRHVSAGYRFSSFSSIVRHLHDSERDVDPGTTGLWNEPFVSREPAKTEITSGSLSLPAGSSFGSLFHTLMEEIDFNAKRDTIEMKARELLKHSGFTEDIAGQITDMTYTVLHTPLSDDDSDFMLCNIPTGDRLVEAGFQAQFGGNIPSADDMPDRSDDIALATCLKNAGSNSTAGYITGFVDLVFRYKNKYYLLDWKTNRLSDSSGGYGPEKLLEAMVREQYPLQYHIYLSALNDYLSSRIPDYSYDIHMGGVFYLFVRGMDGRGNNGIYRHRPSINTVRWFSQSLSMSEKIQDQQSNNPIERFNSNGD